MHVSPVGSFLTGLYLWRYRRTPNNTNPTKSVRPNSHQILFVALVSGQ